MNERLGIEIAEMRSRIADLEGELEVFRNPDKFPHQFAEMCFLVGYKKGISDAKSKGVQS